MSLNDAVDKMRGKVGTKVKLTIRRINQKPFDVKITREEIKIRSVKSELKSGDVAYIRITSFTEDTDKTVEKALAKARKESKNKLKGVVLDVRNNPGGLLDQAVNVSDLFLDKGEIVSTVHAIRKTRSNIPPRPETLPKVCDCGINQRRFGFGFGNCCRRFARS